MRSSIIRRSGNWRGNLKTPKLPKTFRSSRQHRRPTMTTSRFSSKVCTVAQQTIKGDASLDINLNGFSRGTKADVTMAVCHAKHAREGPAEVTAQPLDMQNSAVGDDFKRRHLASNQHGGSAAPACAGSGRKQQWTGHGFSVLAGWRRPR
jgi:hypothetical protein